MDLKTSITGYKGIKNFEYDLNEGKMVFAATNEEYEIQSYPEFIQGIKDLIHITVPVIVDKISITISPAKKSEDKGSNIINADGGAYKDLESESGKQKHHVPANSISPYSREKGPSIKMDTADHRKTSSWGNSKEAQQYRQKQKELIDNGNFQEAQNMDIKDLVNKFGDKYENGIEEMKEYTKKLLR